jgi:CheY-like chemotaxis protein
MNRLVAINALEPYNFKIVEAENGQIAIEILKNNLFDLILMDLQMPVMGGFEATKIIRHELKITTPIIALTANAFKLEIDKCIELGMNNYIIKPFEEIELIEAISQAIGHNKNETSYGYYFETKMPQTDLYNLDKLKEMSRGNNDFIKKMLNIFVETVPDSITEMKVALSNSDFDTVKKIAHKLKPSVDNLGLNIKAEIRNLEKFKVHAATKNVFIEHTYFVMNMLSNVLKSIKENELR